MSMPGGGTAGEASGAANAHPQDSLALAEHIVPQDLKAQIDAIRVGEALRPRLQRAWLYNEYALATPEFKGDDKLFRLGREDLNHIVDELDDRPRHQTRVSAEMLLAYEPAFRQRANLEPISPRIRRKLQGSLGGLMLRFMDGPVLTQVEHGQLSELVAATYLLESTLFPYMGSYREECNIIREDNHDFYTLHPIQNGRVKKAPLSIKYREQHPPGVVLTLAVGRLARQASLAVQVYKEEDLDEARALRLAADIMVCHTSGESLSAEDHAFRRLLTRKLVRPITTYAKRTSVPDYASNAEALKRQMNANAISVAKPTNE
jgi:hypothetical protein